MFFIYCCGVHTCIVFLWKKITHRLVGLIIDVGQHFCKFWSRIYGQILNCFLYVLGPKVSSIFCFIHIKILRRLLCNICIFGLVHAFNFVFEETVLFFPKFHLFATSQDTRNIQFYINNSNSTWNPYITHKIYVHMTKYNTLRQEIQLIQNRNYSVLFTCTIPCCQSMKRNLIYTNSYRLHLWNPPGCQLAWSSWFHFKAVVGIGIHVVSSCYWELCNLRAIFIKVWWSIIKM